MALRGVEFDNSDFIVVTLKVKKRAYLKLKRLVLEKYGAWKGYLGLEASRAFEFYYEYNSKHPYANLQRNLEKPRKKHIRLLLSLYYFDGDVITDRVLNKFIRDLGVISKPTIRDYTNFALAFLWEEHVDRRTKPVTIYYSIRRDLIKEFLEKHGVEVEDVRERESPAETSKDVVKGSSGNGEGRSRRMVRRGVVVESGGEEVSTTTVGEYAVERYEVGDTLEEIKEKVEMLAGAQVSKRGLRSIIRKELRKRLGDAYG